MYKGEWEVTETVTVCSFWGHTTVDFRNATWGDVKVCNLKARYVVLQGNYLAVVVRARV